MSQRDLAASVRARLLNMARERGEDFTFILIQFALQRLLYRLGISSYRDRFLLKGAWLFALWSEEPHRPTRDVDFLGFGDNHPEQLLAIFKDICRLSADDGLIFHDNTFQAAVIKEGADYQGIRISGFAELARARIPIQLDIGFGDVVIPQAEQARLPVFLDLPAPELSVYPVYSVIAEKFQAMVSLGIANSRMKDFYDIRRIAQLFALDGEVLVKAVTATFEQRGTQLTQELPYVLSEAFAQDADKQTQWRAFITKNDLQYRMTFAELISILRTFLGPVFRAAATETLLPRRWSPEQWQWLEQ